MGGHDFIVCLYISGNERVHIYLSGKGCCMQPMYNVRKMVATYVIAICVNPEVYIMRFDPLQICFFGGSLLELIRSGYFNSFQLLLAFCSPCHPIILSLSLMFVYVLTLLASAGIDCASKGFTNN